MTQKITILVFIVLIIGALSYLAIDFNKVEVGKNRTDNKSVDSNKAVTDSIKEANKIAVEEAKSAALRQVKEISADDHIMGEFNAPVQMIIYYDFECQFCARFNDTIKRIKEEFSDKVVIAYRHFPLVFHAMAVPAALSAECAAEQDKFWEMHDKLFANNKSGNMNVEQFKRDAADLGLDKAKFNECLDAEKYKDKIQAQMVEAKNFGVSGTPGNFINGEPAPGAVPFEDFTDSSGRQRSGMKSIIERHLREIEDLVE